MPELCRAIQLIYYIVHHCERNNITNVSNLSKTQNSVAIGISVYAPRCAGSEILPLDTAWFCMVTVLLITKTARIKGVLRRDNALSAYRL